MKIIRELENNVDFSIVKSIYEQGNKIAILYKNDTLLGYEDTVFYDEGDIRSGSLKEAFVIKSGELLVKEGRVIVIDKVVSDKCGDLGFIHPYGDNGELSFLLYNNDIIADTVFEVNVG